MRTYTEAELHRLETINENESAGSSSSDGDGSSPTSRRDFLRGAALAGAGLTAACALPGLLLPAPAMAGLIPKPSAEQQKKIGAEATQKILQQYRQVNDGRSSHFEQIGRRLVNALPQKDRQTWDFKFYVLDSKDVNAFALPGGPMFMFTGLYKLMDTDDALAAVTGHEMTHVRNEHWAKAYVKQQERQGILSIGLILLKGGRAAQTIAGLADSAIGAKFSRKEEDEADKGGLEDLVAAGYNPNGMLQLFQTLQKQSGNGGGLGGEFLSDHPLTSTRISNTQKRIAQLGGERRFPAATPLNYERLTG